MNIELIKQLTCTRCKEVQETHSSIVYSQGDRVCTGCKEITQSADNAMFDIDMGLRRN